MHPEEVGAVMAKTLDKDAIVVSENLTGAYGAFPFGFRENEQMWLGNTGAGPGLGNRRGDRRQAGCARTGRWSARSATGR